MNALWESSVNFMFWKLSNFAGRVLFTCCHILDVHTHFIRVVIVIMQCSKQRRGSSQHTIIATYYRSVKKWNVFIDLELIIFPVQLRLPWRRVSLQSALLCKHECHFVSGISQSNFCIFHNTTESVIMSALTQCPIHHHEKCTCHMVVYNMVVCGVWYACLGCVLHGAVFCYMSI